MNLSLRRKVGILLVSLLLLQMVGLSVVSAAPAPQLSMPGPGMPAPMYHVVRPGETLFAIGRLYRVNPWWIARINMIPNPNIIFVGQMLVIFSPGPGPMPGQMPRPFPSGAQPWPGGWSAGCTTVHVVKSGDTVFSISRIYGVTPWAIARANNLFNPNWIITGQVLCIPAPGPLFVM